MVPAGRFHSRPFDEGTLTKLDIFALYAREWLPVFLAGRSPKWREIHIFDFFAGPGSDSIGRPGSPLRLLAEIARFRDKPGWAGAKVHLHLFDKHAAAIAALRGALSTSTLVPGLELDIRAVAFVDALDQCDGILTDRGAAKLLFIDQFGVGKVTAEIFRRLIAFPTTDFLFFISSSVLHRFAEHPVIKQKITRPMDFYHVHRAALDYYRGLVPDPTSVYLAPFSIKKGSNVYGVIFGSKHPLGMDKFLQVAWKKDRLNGEAAFDINRDNFRSDEPLLPGFDSRPTKVAAFQQDLESRLRTGQVTNENDIVRVCFDHGVRRADAKPVIWKLKHDGVIAVDFRVPSVDRFRSPRPVRLLPKGGAQIDRSRHR